MEEVELDRFLKETVEAFGPDGRSRVEIRTEPVDATAVIDPQRVEQILRNLVDNALKFSPPEAPVLLKGRVTGESVEMSVTDRGPGIAREDQRRIFDRFHQVGEVLSREQEGAGLGLYITKRLVEVLGGTIQLESAPGMGATFRVRIPAGEKATPPTAPAIDVPRAAQGPRGDGQAEVGSPVSGPSRPPGAP